MPIDKQYHFIAGMLIYIIAQSFMPPVWSLIPVIAIGTGKEVIDYVTKKGTPDINDLLYTIYGAFLVLIVKFIFF